MSFCWCAFKTGVVNLRRICRQFFSCKFTTDSQQCVNIVNVTTDRQQQKCQLGLKSALKYVRRPTSWQISICKRSLSQMTPYESGKQRESLCLLRQMSLNFLSNQRLYSPHVHLSQVSLVRADAVACSNPT